MQTRPPTATRILIAVGFALSCFGLALFLWIAFGGPVPLKPESYRITVPFDEATTLAEESDVRISGVSVGKVKSIELGDDGLAEAELELQPAYAPIPMDTRAILRQKTLLGETYVELTPGGSDESLSAAGSETAPPTGTIPEGGTLPEAQVSEAVQLDEIFRTFDEPTRVAFQQWMQMPAVALEGRGHESRRALGELDPFAEETDRALRILDTQSRRCAACLQRRRGVRRTVRAPGPAARADRDCEHGLPDDREAQRRAGRDLPDLPDLPARVAGDPRAARASSPMDTDPLVRSCARRRRS